MIALLPLDDRPCNYQFPLQIAEIGGEAMLLPPRAELGHFNLPANTDALELWLENLPPVEALIVSIDALAYGGLVASRKTKTSLHTALSRLEAIRKFRQARPETPIYAFNVLMRLAITMDSDAAVPHYYNVMRYARLADEATRFPSPEKTAELEDVLAQIPPAILDEYRGARARNHEVNLQMVSWLAEGVFDYLLITQEDCTQFGLHRREQEEILERAHHLRVSEKFALHPGADEAALTLLARGWKTGAGFQIEWSDPARKREIAVFEDVPYEDALLSHIKAMGGTVVEATRRRNDVVLFVNAPVGGSQREESAAQKEVRKTELRFFAARIAAEIEAGKLCAICDVAFPNGADNALLEILVEEFPQILPQLVAFGGWNTAGNTTGTVLAQCAAFGRGDHPELGRQFVFERVVDDWFYQAVVRGQIEAIARESGFSPLYMNGESPKIEEIAREKLEAFALDLAGQFGAKIEKMSVRLPWNRTFEVEFAAKLV